MKTFICENCKQEKEFAANNYRKKTCSRKCGDALRSKKRMADFEHRKKRFCDIWKSLNVSNRAQHIADLIFASNRTVENWYYKNERAIPRKMLDRLEARLCAN